MRKNSGGLWARVSGALDEHMAQALDAKAPRGSELSAEAFARLESEREERRHQIRQSEREQAVRIERWAGTRGVGYLRWVYRVLALLICAGIIAFLMRTVLALPPVGAPDNPTSNVVAQRYLERGLAETGAVNLVSGMILDYRAFDTFGESTVLFVAACSVLLLLKLGEHPDGQPSPAMLEAEYDDRHHEPKNDVVLQYAATALVPVIMLFGLYVVLNGHLSPGGGFSGGAIMGAGLVLYLNAFGFRKTGRFFTYRTFRWITYLSLMAYGLMKSYSFYTGANGIESGIPLGTPGAILSSGLILPLNICVGLIVMCTMYAFYTLFRKGSI